jgi:hypothetical protein
LASLNQTITFVAGNAGGQGGIANSPLPLSQLGEKQQIELNSSWNKRNISKILAAPR